MKDNTLGIKGLNSGIENAGIGYIIIPKELDSAEYIAHCYKTNTVSMAGGLGYGNFHKVSIDEETLQEIDFPKTQDTLGSPIIWLSIPKHDKPVIVGILKYRNDAVTLETNSKRISRESSGNMVDIYAKANSASLDINIIGNEQTDAEFNINIKNKSGNGKFSLNVDGDVIIRAIGKTILVSDDLIQLSVLDNKGKIKGLIKYQLGIGFTYKDEFGNESYMNGKNIQFKPKKIFNIGSGKEPIPLGTTLAGLMDEFITQVSEATVTTIMGPMPLLNAASIALLQKKVDSIKSKISFTD